MLKPLTALVVAILPLTACSVEVNKHGGGDAADVDVRTPAGAIRVRAAAPSTDTGLQVYPNARLSREHGHRESADVSIDTAWFGLKVVAASYETDDEPAKVLEYYRQQMTRYSPFVECRGRVRWRRDDPPSCHDRDSTEVQLAAGIKARQRIVSVKPRASGTEFALVYVNTKD